MPMEVTEVFGEGEYQMHFPLNHSSRERLLSQVLLDEVLESDIQ